MRHVAVFHCSAPKTWKKKQSTSQVQEASDILCIFSASNHSCFTVSHLHSTLLVSRCRGSWFTGLWRFDHMEIWVCYLSCVRTRWKKKIHSFGTALRMCLRNTQGGSSKHDWSPTDILAGRWHRPIVAYRRISLLVSSISWYGTFLFYRKKKSYESFIILDSTSMKCFGHHC